MKNNELVMPLQSVEYWEAVFWILANKSLSSHSEYDKIRGGGNPNHEKDGKFGTGRAAIERALEAQLLNKNDSSILVNAIVTNHRALKDFTPESMKENLEKVGYKVKPLSRGNYKGVLFERGGGYKIVFGGDGVFRYHPAERSHHGGAYWTIASGKGTHRYGLDGNEK